MAEAATTADRKVAVYCGAGLPVEITLKLPTTVAAFGTAVVETLRAEGHLVNASRVVLWRVNVADVDVLQERALAEPGFLVAPTETIRRLPSEAVITGATFADDTRVWVQVLGGGTGTWGGEAAGSSPCGGALLSLVWSFTSTVLLENSTVLTCQPLPTPLPPPPPHHPSGVPAAPAATTAAGGSAASMAAAASSGEFLRVKSVAPSSWAELHGVLSSGVTIPYSYALLPTHCQYSLVHLPPMV
jgi:hypothetical protein